METGARGRLEKALGLYSRALEADPGLADQAFLVARSWEEKGAQKGGGGLGAGARTLYALILGVNAEHGPSAWRLALGLEGAQAEDVDMDFGVGEEGAQRDIVGLLGCVLQSNLSMAEEVYLFGRAREARGDLEGGLIVYALVANETHGSHAASMARSCFVLHRLVEDYDRAEAMYARAVETSSVDEETMLGYGQLLEKVRDKAQAAQVWYRRAERCNPTHVDVLLHLAKSLHRAGGSQLAAARALYERGVVLCADRNALARAREGVDGVGVDPEIHVALLASYADLLREQRAEFNRVEDLYLAVLEHDPEHEQALLGQMLLLLEAGKDDAIADYIVHKLVAKGTCSNARLWFEYGRRSLSDAPARARGPKEAFSVALTVQVGSAVSATVWDRVLHMDLWALREVDSSTPTLDLPSESVLESVQSSQQRMYSVSLAGDNTESTLTIDAGDMDVDWGCPPSQRASEIAQEVEDSSLSGGGRGWPRGQASPQPVSYTHLRAHETEADL
eukprot:3061076-Rhodomonas_salina.4